MKFVFLTYNISLHFNRAEDWFYHLRHSTGVYDALGKKHTVISIEQINHTGRIERNGVDYHFLNYRKKKLYFPTRLHRYIKALSPDVIVVHGMHFPLQVLQLRAQVGRHARIILQNHADQPGSGKRKILQTLADRSIDAYLFVSKEQGEQWVSRGIIANSGKIREVMEASSLFIPQDRSLARSRTATSGDPLFLWVGRLDRNKDPLTVLEAFILFAKIHPAARLYMVYHTEELLSEIREFVAATGVGDAVVLVGKIEHQQLQDWYNAAEFILSGSHYEGSGIAVCEAMSCGCIPVVTDISSFRKMTGNGGCGILYPPGNKDALLAALLETRSMDKVKERQKVLDQFRSELSFEAIAGGIDAVASSL
ncbi:MAG TPA: glycosyltransferase family 4 protein [Puia sp.]|jgi:glycosyltransferase involved in cell wall biosynthesis|nr:glycosyltransferase family 4 protein [Puia sp.]